MCNILYIEGKKPILNRIEVNSLVSGETKVDTTTTIISAINKLGLDHYDFVLIEATIPDYTEESIIPFLNKHKIPFAIISNNGVKLRKKYPVWSSEITISEIKTNIKSLVPIMA